LVLAVDCLLVTRLPVASAGPVVPAMPLDATTGLHLRFASLTTLALGSSFLRLTP
jgi:hypothetical protein